MMLLIYDKANNRFKEVHTNENMTIEKVNSIMMEPKAPKYRRVFSGEIFKDAEEDGQDDHEEEDQLSDSPFGGGEACSEDQKFS